MAFRLNTFFALITVSAVTLTGCAQAPSANGPLIRLGDQQGVASEAGNKVSADAAWWQPVNYTYVAGEGLSLEGEPGNVYRLDLAGDPMKVAANVARVFGVQGPVERVEESWGTPTIEPMPADGSTVTSKEDSAVDSFVFYSVGSRDWTAPSVQLYWNGTGSWSYQNPQAYEQMNVECAPSAPSEVTQSDGQSGDNDKGDSALESSSSDRGCLMEPNKPRDLPSKEQARADALKIFAATGLSVSADDITVYADDWGVSANASLQVAGEPVAVEWSVGWGDGGVISSAWGHSVSVVDMGTFDTISDRDSVSRLGDWRWYGGAASKWYAAMGYPGAATMSDRLMSPESSPEEGNIGSSDSDMVGEPGLGYPYEGEPVEPMEVTVVIEDSKRALLTIYDASGTIWIVPGYVLSDLKQGVYAVVALPEGVIEMPDLGPLMSK